MRSDRRKSLGVARHQSSRKDVQPHAATRPAALTCRGERRGAGRLPTKIMTAAERKHAGAGLPAPAHHPREVLNRAGGSCRCGWRAQPERLPLGLGHERFADWLQTRLLARACFSGGSGVTAAPTATVSCPHGRPSTICIQGSIRNVASGWSTVTDALSGIAKAPSPFAY